MSAWVPEHDKQQLKASAKVTDSTNSSKPELKSHQAARDHVALQTLTSTSTTVKRTPTSTFPLSALTTTTISQSTAATGKQPASILDVEDKTEDSHILLKGLFPLHSFLIQVSYCQNFPASSSKKSCVVLSDNEIEEELPISMISLLRSIFNF